jgi:peptidyl-prolyl cis-trans isomerase SurA
VKVNDKRPARGEVKAAHIMLRTGPSATAEVIADAKAKADSAYAFIQAGGSFDEAVEKYSQDEGSKPNHGVMNWMGSFSNFP